MIRNLIIGFVEQVKCQPILGIVILLALVLSGCTHKRPYPPAPRSINVNLTHETWQAQVENNPNKWSAGADRWFLTGDPNATETENRTAPYSEAMSTMMVKVPNFSKIKINGDFQVQIFGTYGHNSVYLYGPNDVVELAGVEVRGDTLCISQVQKVPFRMHKVIVRIGINHLNSLTQMGGNGSIEAIRLQSSSLYIMQGPKAHGNIFLSGNMNVTNIIKLGAGCINVFGVNSPALEIKTEGKGAVNVSGNVGVRLIKRRGKVEINIMGANSDSLVIDADGIGKISLSGPVNIREIYARGSSCIYANHVASNPSLYVYLYGKSKVGLTGYARNLYIDAYGMSLFAGRHLCSQNAFARTADFAHINVSASGKIFAAATNSGSVYFYGMPGILSQFQRDNGLIMPIWYEESRICPLPGTGVVQAVSPPPPRDHYVWRNKKLMNYRGQG